MSLTCPRCGSSDTEPWPSQPERPLEFCRGCRQTFIQGGIVTDPADESA